MANFGLGIYFITVIWFVTLMLCWVSARTGHYIGKLAIGVSVVITIILVALPKGEVQYLHGANFYDKLFVPRYAILTSLLISFSIGLAYAFVSICLSPVETKKVRSFGTAK